MVNDRSKLKNLDIPEHWKGHGIGWDILWEQDLAAWEFVNKLIDQRVTVWMATPIPNYVWPSKDEHIWPKGWPRITPDIPGASSHSRIRLGGYESGCRICANTGEKLAVVDVDPRNGGDIERVRKLLADLGVRVFAEVITPGGGRHFYVAGHPDLPSRQTIEGWPGVEIKSHKANITLPGTLRPKYGGAGYTIVFNDLQALDEPTG